MRSIILTIVDCFSFLVNMGQLSSSQATQTLQRVPSVRPTVLFCIWALLVAIPQTISAQDATAAQLASSQATSAQATSAQATSAQATSAQVRATAETAGDRIEFNRDVRPILSDNCFFCHGPDKNTREADLRLDTLAGLHGTPEQDGLPAKHGAIVPGQPEASELFVRITSSDHDHLMPPPETGKLLTAEQIQILKKWIAQGGQFEGHWAFQPIRPLAATTADTPANPQQSSERIDHYVRQALSEQNLTPNAPADRITLLRRLSFDLTGLPPTAAEVADFVADQSPQAYQKVVDRLLSSPHYGERMAMWWLDLVRYADTVGYHGDQQMSVSPFRDYVIQSFNDNKPFDQFTIEQLAGDLLPEQTREQQIASGYNRLGMMSAEGGVQPKEYLAKYIAERVRNTTGTWLGITLGCAECHDNKFDPLTTRDFYQFQAFFADIKERGLYSGGDWGSFIQVPSEQQAAEMQSLDEKIANLKSVLDMSTPELVAAQIEWEQSQRPWTTLTADSITSLNGATMAKRDDGSILVSGTNPATDSYELTFSNLPPGITALRLEVLPDDSLPRKGPGRAGNGNFVLSELTVTVIPPANGEMPSADSNTAPSPPGASDAEQAGSCDEQQPSQENLVTAETASAQASPPQAVPIPLQNATATYEQVGAAGNNPYKKWAVEAAIDGDVKGRTWGWAIMEQAGQPNFAVFETTSDLTVPPGASLRITMAQNLDNPGHNLGCFRWSVTTSARPVQATDAPPAEMLAILNTPVDQRSEAQKAALASHYRSVAPLLQPERDQLAALEQQKKDLNARIPTTLVTETVPPRMVRVLPRGNWMDESGEEVLPAFPEIFAAQPSTDRRLNRLDLARWIMQADNPLTSRVMVNRFWKLLFGSGLSRKLDDLGAQGEWPSHPLLLDYLADDFRTNGWNIKRTIKAIVMSQTYQQSSQDSPQLREVDPYNRWLARQGRIRVDAEIVRDNALAISGLLVDEVGGKSVFPYQPDGYWAYLNFPTLQWKNDQGDKLYRRGLYTHWQRQYLHPSLQAFDAPSREECTADRPRSNTPLQSLVLLNDPSYVEAARVFAELILREGGASTADRLQFAFRRAVSRAATSDELNVLQQLLEAQQLHYKNNAADAQDVLTVGAHPAAESLDTVELAAWTSVARTLLNLHEVITRY